MAATPASMQALVVTEAGTQSLEHIAVPSPQPNQALVQISHVAQNPTDVQSLDANAFGAGAVLGCDFVGTVTSVGAEASRLSLGDRVAGLIWGGEKKGLGAYSEYTVADDAISFKVPPSIPPADAATVPLAAATAWLALFSQDSLRIPRERSGQVVLIWGGSSSVGQYAIQLAKLEGLRVVTTCSPRNFDMIKALGAEYVADYRDADVVQQIQTKYPDLAYVFDTIGSVDSSASAAGCVTKQGKLCTVRPGKANTESVPKHVAVSDVLVWTCFLSDHRYGDFFWPASESDFKLAKELFDQLPELLTSKKLLPNKCLALNGFADVPRGFEMYRKGEYSAQKIVYCLERDSSPHRS